MQRIAMISCLSCTRVDPGCARLNTQSPDPVQVEHCAGTAKLSRAFTHLGFRGKRLDVPWLKRCVCVCLVCLCTYKLRLATAATMTFYEQSAFSFFWGRHLESTFVCTCVLSHACIVFVKVMNAAPYGFLMAAPPCSSFVFMLLILHLCCTVHACAYSGCRKACDLWTGPDPARVAASCGQRATAGNDRLRGQTSLPKGSAIYYGWPRN